MACGLSGRRDASLSGDRGADETVDATSLNIRVKPPDILERLAIVYGPVAACTPNASSAVRDMRIAAWCCLTEGGARRSPGPDIRRDVYGFDVVQFI